VLEGLINDAETAAGAVVSKYAFRASVVIPFLFALIFATLAITVALVDRYGAVYAFASVATGYAVIGFVAALMVANAERAKSRQRVAAPQTSATAATAEVAKTVIAEAPLAMIATLLGSVGGPTAALGATRVLARNWPLVVLAGLIGVLVFAKGDAQSTDVDSENDTKPDPSGLNGFDVAPEAYERPTVAAAA
jgi:hypothetical protein